MVVDFPAPFGPRKPVTRPGSARKVTWSTAVKPPYFLVSESTMIMARTLASGAPATSGSVLIRSLPATPATLKGLGVDPQGRGDVP